MTSKDLLDMARIIINDTPSKEMCNVCFELIEGSHVHICNPEQRANDMAGFLAMASTKKRDRARGYGVR